MPRILVVEDYPDNMALMEEILEDEGFDIYKAEDAEIGLSILNDNPVDLILMDISLPNMSGHDATRLIRKNPDTADIPVIALTAHAMQEDRDRAMEAGCTDYLSKPVDDTLLIETIRKILA